MNQCLKHWLATPLILLSATPLILCVNDIVQAKERMVKRVRRIVEERSKNVVIMDSNANEYAVNDVVDVLLRDKLGDSSSLTLEMISQNIIEMMIPGEETLPTAMTMALNFLSHSPLALSKLMVRNVIYIYISLIMYF